MPPRDYETTPVADALDLRGVIGGLAADLEALRARQITPADALARAAVAKQLWNGVRLYLVAQAYMDGQARALPAPEDGDAP